MPDADLDFTKKNNNKALKKTIKEWTEEISFKSLITNSSTNCNLILCGKRLFNI